MSGLADHFDKRTDGIGSHAYARADSPPRQRTKSNQA